jgi:hypothetical protein
MGNKEEIQAGLKTSNARSIWQIKSYDIPSLPYSKRF